MAAAAPTTAGETTANPASDQNAGDSTTNHTQPARTGGAHEGDDHVSYGNAQGLCEPGVWDPYLHDHILTTSSLHGVLETMWTDAIANKNAWDLQQAGEGRMYSAQGGS